jgi:hypothetical protein
LQRYLQYQVIIKPSPDNIQEMYLDSLKALGINPKQHDIRFVEDNWEAPTLGAWGLGWEVWLDGMEITQFTYFQQVGGIDCNPVTAEITYGLERIAMYLQDVDSIFDIEWVDGINYGDVKMQIEKENSIYNHLNYSYAINNKHVFNSYFYLGRNKTRQNIAIESPVLNDFFSASDDAVIYQNSANTANSYGLKSNLFSDWGNLEHRLDLGYESLNESRSNDFYLENSNTSNTEVDSLQNNLSFNQREISLKSKTSYSFSEKVKIGIGLSMNYIDIGIGEQDKNAWLFNPEIDVDLRKLKIGRFIFSYEKAYDLPESKVFLQNYQLINYRSFQRGLGELKFLEREVYKFNYRWANDLESQAISFRLKYDNYEDRFSTTNQISEDFSLSTFRLVDAGERFSASLDFTSYFENLNFSTNFKTSQNLSISPVALNSTEFNDLENYSSSYHFTASTYFNWPINFGFAFNFYNNESDFNGTISKTQWANESLELTYSISDEWHASVNNELYQIENNSSYFLGSTINYKPNNSDFSYRMVMHNLANERSFDTVMIDEFITYRSSIPLLSRYFFMEVKYRF